MYPATPLSVPVDIKSVAVIAPLVAYSSFPTLLHTVGRLISLLLRSVRDLLLITWHLADTFLSDL